LELELLEHLVLPDLLDLLARQALPVNRADLETPERQVHLEVPALQDLRDLQDHPYPVQEYSEQLEQRENKEERERLVYKDTRAPRALWVLRDQQALVDLADHWDQQARLVCKDRQVQMVRAEVFQGLLEVLVQLVPLEESDSREVREHRDLKDRRDQLPLASLVQSVRLV